MSDRLTVVGGTYYENCIDPEADDFYGSGMRGAAALSGKGLTINLISCIAKRDLNLAHSICSTFDIQPEFHFIDKTIIFQYYHPLSLPEIFGLPDNGTSVKLADCTSTNILFYGMIEAQIEVHGKRVVYDPQNHISFVETGSTANHLALVLNKKEAHLLSGANESDSLGEIGHTLLKSQNAEVVVIKNGPHGAIVVDKNRNINIPVFETRSVWPIGSGDIFSAAFAWQWGLRELPAGEAALLASKYTAGYCQSRLLPLPNVPENFSAIRARDQSKKIYLAGPFFTMSQRWLINEFRFCLSEMGIEVFSPFHDLGLVQITDIKSESGRIAKEDLDALQQADTVLAVLCDLDAGTLFEIGHAVALEKEVIVFSENISETHLLMLYGTRCKIVSDFSTAVYAASW